jgi:glutathione transport system substrate-binding protein
VNLAINRPDLLHYATRGNGVIIPGIVAAQSFGYHHDLAPYPFAPDKARHLFREAGYPEGFALTLIAAAALEVQATVVSKMLEQAGLQVDFQLLDSATYNRKTALRFLDQPPEHQTWDIALGLFADPRNFPIYTYYARALGGSNDWVTEQPTLRQLYEQTLHTVEREKQQAFIRQMERHTSAQASFLFLYNAIQLYAVNKAVAFVPYVNTRRNLVETTVTEHHWSVRKQKTAGQEEAVANLHTRALLHAWREGSNAEVPDNSLRD